MIKLPSRKKTLILAAGLLVLAAAGYYGVTSQGKETAEAVTEEAVVERGDLKLSWKSDGSAEREAVYLDFSVGGVLKAVYIQEGEYIKKGQVLAEIEADNYREQYQTAEINYRKAQAAYASAISSKELSDISERQQLNSTKVALDKAAAEYLPISGLTEVYSAQELELSRVAYESAKSAYESQLSRFDLMRASNTEVATQKANLEAADIALEQARQDLKDTVLVAETDGRVLSISGKTGDYVRSSTDADSSDSNHLFTLATNEQVNVVVSVQEIDYGKLTVDQTAEVSFEAAEGKTYPARVISVEVLPTIDTNGIVTYEATLALEGEAPEIQTGMSGTVEFIQKQQKDVLIIPNKAVSIANKKQVVSVKTAAGTAEQRVITTGFTDGTQAEVLSGLEAGETLLITTVKTGAKK